MVKLYTDNEGVRTVTAVSGADALKLVKEVEHQTVRDYVAIFDPEWASVEVL